MTDAFFSSIETALNKIAIFVSTKNDKDGKDYHLITRNKDVINKFNPGFVNIPYASRPTFFTLEAFELRYDTIVNIDITKIIDIYYYGVPKEISPPMFLNPEMQGLVSDDLVRALQWDCFLNRVKAEKDAGHYKNPEKLKSHYVDFFNLKHFFKQEYDIGPEDHPLFDFFDNYYVYNFNSNTVKGDKILEVQKTMYFLPAILKCAGIQKDQVKSILAGLVDRTAFSKERWIDVLNEKHAELLQKYVQERDAIGSLTEEGLDDEAKAALQKQYDILIDKLKTLSFADEIALYDDYRLYLRYWPELFEPDEFHTYIRPFTDIENKVLKIFIKNDFEFDYDEIYRSEYDFYNSIIFTFEKYTDQWREIMYDKIVAAAEKRSQEILLELEPLIDTLPEEDKQQLLQTIEDVKDLDKYRKDLDSFTRLVDVLSYWPVALYPVPEDVLKP